MNRSADWLAWILHFGAGLFLGTLVGRGIVYGKFHDSSWLPDPLAPLFVVGSALVSAGLASHHGDRMWMSGYSGMIPPEGIRHNRVSHLLSIISVVTGSLLILTLLVLFFTQG